MGTTRYGLNIEAASHNNSFMPNDELVQSNNVKEVAAGSRGIQGHKNT